ncbi:hypothetical protein K438DRAFT_1788182 [Mycena galopus ATCC 62051]|nr:hypothetical protein K438DRAFT_1788182 [Mycena galopus ATCC 62051]
MDYESVPSSQPLQDGEETWFSSPCKLDSHDVHLNVFGRVQASPFSVDADSAADLSYSHGTKSRIPVVFEDSRSHSCETCSSGQASTPCDTSRTSCLGPFPTLAFPEARPAGLKATTDEFNELVLDSFTNAAFDAGLEEAEPTPEDMKLIRSRVPTFRGGLKDVVRDLVPSAYNLERIETLKNPTPELINATLEKNRARVDKIIKSFIYSDPDNITPQTMFLHDIFQHGFTGYWFGENENNRAFYFEGKTRVELVTLALIIVAPHQENVFELAELAPVPPTSANAAITPEFDLAP